MRLRGLVPNGCRKIKECRIKMALGEQGAANTTPYASCETSPQLTVRVAVVITREVVTLHEIN
jgi:hypothetical protein